jgi:hypothetical protein
LISTVLSAAEPNLGVRKQSVGLAFQVQGLSVLADNVHDGAIAGVGVRFWLLEELVLRAIVYFDFQYDSATDENSLWTGLSLGAEYHFVKGVVSPYAGAMLGLEAVSAPAGDGIDWHGGALVGVELTPLEFLSVFLEYTLVVTFRETGTEIDLGYNHLPIIGVIIYLN